MVKLSYEDVTNYPESVEAYFGFNGKSGVIRNDDNKLVGFYTINVDEPLVELCELEIVEDFRGMGYGRAFIEELFRKFKNCDTIEGQSTEEAVYFYATIGANFTDSCATCNYEGCFNSLFFKGAVVPHSDTCDDYSDNIFKIKRKED